MDANMSTTYVIETHELSKTYKYVDALKPLNLRVQQNSIFGFLGPNGAGKTTTIKLLRLFCPAHRSNLVILVGGWFMVLSS